MGCGPGQKALIPKLTTFLEMHYFFAMEPFEMGWNGFRNRLQIDQSLYFRGRWELATFLGSDYFSEKNYLKKSKRAMSDIHPRTFELELTVRVGAKLRC